MKVNVPSMVFVPDVVAVIGDSTTESVPLKLLSVDAVTLTSPLAIGANDVHAGPTAPPCDTIDSQAHLRLVRRQARRDRGAFRTAAGNERSQGYRSKPYRAPHYQSPIPDS